MELNKEDSCVDYITIQCQCMCTPTYKRGGILQYCVYTYTIYIYIYIYSGTLKKGHFGKSTFVQSLEVVLISEVHEIL